MIGKSVSFRSIFSDRELDAHQSSDAEQVTNKKNTLPDPEFAHRFHFSVGFREISLTARLQPYVKSIWLIAAIGMVLILGGFIGLRNHNIQSQYNGKPVSNQSMGLVSLSNRTSRSLQDTSLKQQLKIAPVGYGTSHSIGLLKDETSPAEEVCGGINVPTTWSAPVIIITCNVSVGEGGVLTILPGTVVKFNTDPVFGKGTLYVGRGGKLYAQGTESEPVVFTSYLDDEHGGDTNQDGTATTPQGGDWAKIEFRSGYGRISHAWIGYGAGYQTNWSLPKGMVVASRDGSAPLKESDVILDHVTLTKSGHTAIVTSYSSLTIRNSQIYDNTFGINTCVGWGCSGVPPIVDARYNWWGHPSGPFVCDYYSNPLGEGDSVCGGGVLFYPWIGDISTYGMLPAHFTLSGPNTASAGQVVDYAITYRSSPTTTVENAIALVVLPSASSYVTSTHGGIYWPERNEVFWKLGDLPPNSEGSLSVEVEIYWGIPEGTSDGAMALMAGSNWGQTALDVAPYLTYTPTKVLSTLMLTEDDLNAERVVYPDFDLLFTEAISDGFTFGDINRITLSAGEVFTQVVLVQKENEAVMFLRRPLGEANAVTYDPTSLTVRTSTGGMRFDVQTGKTEYLDFDGSASSYEALLSTCQLTEGQCLFNCMLDVVSGKLTGKIKSIGNTLTSIDCARWVTFGDENSKMGCLLSIAGIAPGVAEALSVTRCSNECANPAWRDLHVCTGEKIVCENGGLLSDISGLLPPEFFVLSRSITYDCIDNCRYDYGSGDYCRGGTKCVKGKGCVECWGPSATSQDFKEAAQEACLAVQQTGGFCDYCSTDYTIAHDPNAKHGVDGEVLPGQLITYTLEYENEGSGTAYGVFVVDELDEDLDDTTLTLSEGGNYITDTRTLLWDIGNLNPVGQVGSSGVVTFTVGISDGAPGGTIIFNQATIYFPSAQEETPTNPVVNIVQPVIAEPQSVETTYTQSIPITLSGKDVSSAALTYNVVEGPSFGELTGSPPDLTYTPMENHIGLDKFSFTANNGITESLPALIQIQVHPSPDDTTPPQVLWTSPDDGEVIEQIDALPIITGAAGPMYSPLIIVQFSEPLSSTTVTTATVTMISSSENNVKVIPGYDAASRRIMIYSGEPWQTSGYTVTLKQGITDASGNPLQADHLWSFEMVAAESPYEYIFLPLIEQQ